MESQLRRLEYEVELQTGERLTLPSTLVDSVGAGRWVITIEAAPTSIRSHSAFLNSYAAADEGLYDDCAAG